MDEATYRYDPDKAAIVRPILRALLETVIDWSRAG